MRFSAMHKTASYLLVLSAVGALLLSPEMARLTAALALAGIAASWFAEPARYRAQRYVAAWNVATVAIFIYLIADVLRGGSVITSGAYFLLFVLVNKLFNRRTSKDYQQAYVISFLILIVATTLNTNMSYAVCFALFTLFATWSLTLLHLRREMEENYLLKHADGLQSEKVEVERILSSRRIVSGSFLAGTSLLSVGILAGAVLVFLLFPRIGFGLFLGHKRGGVTMVGFSDRVELGQHGLIRDNPRVVMRVVFSERPARALRWRGSVYDHYDNGVWSHGPELIGVSMSVTPHDDLYIMNHAPGLPIRMSPEIVREQLVRQEIYLEPLDSTVIFAADRPIALQIPRSVVGRRPFFVPRLGPHGEIRGRHMRTAGVRYVAYSHMTPPGPEQLRAAAPLKDRRLDYLLQIPAGLPARVAQLAHEIAADKPTVYDKVMAIQDHLRRRYRYTLDLTHDSRLEPVDEFLFVTRRGHCEYFASAMALMLRTLGIHARQVNGFAGGHWNAVGNYQAVRQGDAHAWVEVLFAGVGWVAVDPAPSGRAPAVTTGPAGLTDRLSQLMDTLRLRWFRYVVEYDLGKQVGLFRGVTGVFRTGPTGPSWIIRNKWSLGGAAAGALLTAGAWLWWRRRLPGPVEERSLGRTLPPAAALYHKLLATLRRAGYLKPAGDTPGEFARSLHASGFDGAELVDRFTRRYYELRYRRGAVDEVATDELRELLTAVREGVRRNIGPDAE